MTITPTTIFVPAPDGYKIWELWRGSMVNCEPVIGWLLGHTDEGGWDQRAIVTPSTVRSEEYALAYPDGTFKVWGMGTYSDIVKAKRAIDEDWKATRVPAS